jgi:5-methylcytosine-specific restriction protein A
MTKRPPIFEPKRIAAPAFERAEDARPSAAKRGYDSKWRVIRAAFLKAHPVCECGAPATEADHRRPLRDGGTHAWANLRPMCKPCHSRKTTARDGGFGNSKKSLDVGGVDRVGDQTSASAKLVF